MADSTTTSSETNDLGAYIRGVVFKNYKENRNELETRWQRNRAATEVNLEFDEHGTWKKSERAEEWQSDTMFDTVRQKVTAAKAIISDTAFKGSKVNFMLVHPEEPNQPTEGGADPIVEQNEKYIGRQLQNCDAVTEFGKCVLSGATYGRYFAKRYTTKMINDGFEPVDENVFVEVQGDETTMGVENISVFNMFWDMEKDDLTEGEAVIQIDHISPFDLREKKGEPLYLDVFIDRAIKNSNRRQGDTQITDDTSALPTKLRDIKNRSRNIHIIEFWGRVPRSKVESFEAMLEDHEDIQRPESRYKDDEEIADGDMIEIFAMMANDEVIAYLRTDDPRERPFYMGDWEEVLDGNCGRSIADNLYSVMKVLNGAVRTLEDNMKMASKLIIALKRAMMIENFEKEVGGDKAIVTLTIDEESQRGVREAVEQLKIDSMIGPLSELITLFLEFADMSSSIPRAEQGQQSVNPQTAFELQQRLERSGKYMAEIIKRMDKFIETIITDFYRYNMMDPDLPVEKGVFRVKALGFSSFENQYIRLQKLLQLFGLIIDRPDILAEVNLRWMIEEIAKAMDIEPDQLLKSDEQKQAEAEAQANSPEVQAAQQAQALAIEGQQIENQKNASDIEKNAHDMALDEEKLKIERAKVVNDARAKQQQAAAAKAKPKKESQ